MFDNVKRATVQSMIKNKIINVLATNQMEVCGAEPGIGKTTAMIEGIVEAIKAFPDRKYLVVTPFTRANTRGEFIADLINHKMGHTIAIGIDHGNYRSMMNHIKGWPVVVITSSRYRKLSKSKEQYNLFAKDRYHLIDESINYVDEISVSMKWLDNTELILPRMPRSVFADLTDPIRELLLLSPQNASYIELLKPQNFNDRMKNLIEMIDASYTPSYTKGLQVFEELKINKNNLIAAVKRISEFYNKSVIYTVNYYSKEAELITYDSRIKPVRSKYSLMVNASVDLNDQYNSTLYKRISSPKARDYGNFHMHILHKSSSKISLRASQNYYELLMQHLDTNAVDGDKILVLTQSEFKDKIRAALNQTKPYEIAFEHFFNLVGSNRYFDFNKVYVLGTPSFTSESIILNYQYYMNNRMKSSNGIDDLDIRRYKDGYVSRFCDQKIEKYRVNQIVDELVQSILRINRTGLLQSHIYIMNHDEKVIEGLVNAMQGIRVTVDFDVPNLTKKKIYDNTQRHQRSKASELIVYLKSLLPGAYKKKEVRNALGVNTSQHFSKLLKTSEVVEFMKRKGIKTQGQSIIIPKC